MWKPVGNTKRDEVRSREWLVTFSQLDKPTRAEHQALTVFHPQHRWERKPEEVPGYRREEETEVV